MKAFMEKKYIAYYLGDPLIRCHVDALHSKPPKSDLFTKKLVEDLVFKTNCCGIYSLISRTEMDLNRPINNLNRPGILEYRETITEILKYLKILKNDKILIKPYLHLAFHGMEDRKEKDIEIGTLCGQTCSERVCNWFKEKLEKNSKIFLNFIKIVYNQQFRGNISKKTHREKYGKNFNTFQIELSFNLRKNYYNKLVQIFSNIILSFSNTF